ncbi:hypothetical protein QE152_g10432 [Popillia japonica]|uniref:Uncharacterized protein n=1 Tax=Popillia japonica TaxID=7064 RepID=A0AAW1LRJ3_POPJA
MQENLSRKLCHLSKKQYSNIFEKTEESIGQGASSRFLKWVHATAPLQIPNLWFSTDMENKEDIQCEVNTSTSQYHSISFSSEMKENNNSVRRRITPSTPSANGNSKITFTRFFVDLLLVPIDWPDKTVSSIGFTNAEKVTMPEKIGRGSSLNVSVKRVDIDLRIEIHFC